MLGKKKTRYQHLSSTPLHSLSISSVKLVRRERSHLTMREKPLFLEGTEKCLHYYYFMKGIFLFQN